MLGTLELPKGSLELRGEFRVPELEREREGGSREAEGVRLQRAPRGTRQARHAGGSHGALHTPIVVAVAHELKH